MITERGLRAKKNGGLETGIPRDRLGRFDEEGSNSRTLEGVRLRRTGERPIPAIAFKSLANL